MKNETIKNEEANQQKALQQNSLQSSQQELPPLDNARRLQAVREEILYTQDQLHLLQMEYNTLLDKAIARSGQ